MYPGVPSTAPARVSAVSPASPVSVAPPPPLPPLASASPTTRAMPQSSTYTSPYPPSITFAGLRSRWITPRACAKSIARHTSANARSIRCADSLRPAITSASVVPASRFIVKYGRPSASSPSSCTGTIAG